MEFQLIFKKIYSYYKNFLFIYIHFFRLFLERMEMDENDDEEIVDDDQDSEMQVKKKSNNNNYYAFSLIFIRICKDFNRS